VGATGAARSARGGDCEPLGDAIVPVRVLLQLRQESRLGSQGGKQPVEGQHSRVVRAFASAARQLREAAYRLSWSLRVQRSRARQRLLASGRTLLILSYGSVHYETHRNYA